MRIATMLLLLLIASAAGQAGVCPAARADEQPATAPMAPLAARDAWVAWVARAGDPEALFQRAFEPAVPALEATDRSVPRPLDPPKAALLSMLVPGAAQMHDRKIRGYAMLGAEIGAWFAYQALRSGGHDRENSAETMARSAYSVDVYRRNATVAGENPAKVQQNADQLADWLQHSPSEYYDAIAREPDLVYGWTDYEQTTSGEPGSSVQQATYLKRREDGNRLLKHANTLLSGVLVNHVVSAFDAYRTARNQLQRHVLGFKMKIDVNPFSGTASLKFARNLW